MNWILILTLINGQSVSIQTTKFETSAACDRAAYRWIQSMPTDVVARSICVKSE